MAISKIRATTGTSDEQNNGYWYIDNGGTAATFHCEGMAITDDSLTVNSGWTTEAAFGYGTPGGSAIEIQKKKGINPVLVFKLWKKKMGVMGDYRYNARIKKLKKLAAKYAMEGHDALSTKFLRKLAEEVRLAEISAAGVKMFIQKSLITKYKNDIRGGHISDTLFDKYTNVIPDRVLKKKKKVEKAKVFDNFVIYHYYNSELEEKKEKKEPIKADEKSAMKDPILFGVCDDIPDKLFFIDEWDDDYCDLSFSELVDKIKLDDEDVEIQKPSLDIGEDKKKK